MQEHRETVMRKNVAGFTLIELLMTLAVLGIITALAAPSLNSIFERRRAEGAANELAATLRYAKSEAIKRNANVVVRFKTGTDFCYGIAAASCDCTSNNCDKVVRAQNAAMTLATGSASLTWASTGLPDAQNTITITSGGTSRQVVVNPIGRIKIQ